MASFDEVFHVLLSPAPAKMGVRGEIDMKKKEQAASSYFCFLSALIAVFHSIHASELSPLAQIAEGMEQRRVTVDEWTLHAKKI